MKTYKILFVEDDRIVQLSTQMILKKISEYLRIILCVNGEEALLKMSSDIDLIIMDIGLPGMNGFETTKAIRQNPSWSHVPIIAVTANFSETHKGLCFDAGMNDFITKPLTIDKAQGMMNTYLQGFKNHDQLAKK